MKSRIAELARLIPHDDAEAVITAAVHEAYENAAKVCDKEAAKWESDGAAPEPMSRLCALAIRKLKE
jgi:hypothetical protein